MFWKIINPFTIAIASSSFHSLMSQNIVVLYFKGVKTGKNYAVPVSYYEEPKGKLSCITDRPNIWWRNLLAVENIKILYKGSFIKADISVEYEDNKLIADQLEALCKHSRIDGFFAEVGYKNGEPIRQDVEASAEKMVLMRLLIN